MRAILSLFSLLVLFATTVAAAPAHRPAAHAAAPKALGQFQDWTAAVHQEGSQTVCYAFTRAQTSVPKLAGRGDVVLTVTERPTGRDAVAISAGFTYAQGAEVLVQVDQTGFHFYTAQRNAFAREGERVVQAMLKGRQALARSPGPRGAQITDTFSLIGFTQAYNAIVKTCPAK